MGLPSKKRTPRSRDERRAHHALSTKQLNTCEKCGNPSLPHRVCGVCGSYKGKQVINVEKRLNRKIKHDKKTL